MAVARSLSRLVPKNQVGNLGPAYIQVSNYSSDNLNLAAWKRGTGGRSSFNGIVATVFGNSGFVGTYLCQRLGRVGTQIILPYRCDHYDIMRLKVVGDLGQVLYQPFELKDVKSVEKAVKYSNVVFNLIGRDYETKNYKFKDVHIEGVRTIARACKNAGVERLIQLSYLNSAENPEPVVMKTPSQFQTSKWEGEQILFDEFPEATLIKAADIYGAEDRFLISFAHHWRRQGHYMPLWFGGERTEKQPVYVTDVAQGLINAAKDPDARGKTYQAVGPKRYQLSELVDWFYRVMRKDKKMWQYWRYDMRFDPFFQAKVALTEALSPAYPLGNLHWETIERETTSDRIDTSVPMLEDLGVTPQSMEDKVPWLLWPHRAFAYYYDEIGEFEKPAPPPVIPV